MYPLAVLWVLFAVVISGLAALLVVWLGVILVSKLGAVVKGQSRCAFCGSGLKPAGGRKLGYASACWRCGRTQPWATPGPGVQPPLPPPTDPSPGSH